MARTYGRGRNLRVIADVSVVVCSHCGEKLTAETLHEIERIKLHRHSFAQERLAAVAQFA